MTHRMGKNANKDELKNKKGFISLSTNKIFKYDKS